MKTWTNLAKYSATVGLVVSVAFLVGCGGPAPVTTAPSAAPVGTPVAPNIDFGADVAGLPIEPSANPAEVKNLIAMQTVRPRQDPFGLSPQEIAFDRSQEAERLVSQEGNMGTMYVPPPPPSDTPPVTEPQPPRRVSGILVGDSVVAIIEMGNGKGPAIVRPGQYVPDTPWYVVSIDQEKVVLRRAGNVLPKEITVRLEQKAPGSGGGGGGGGAGGARAGGNGPNAPSAAGSSGGGAASLGGG